VGYGCYCSRPVLMRVVAYVIGGIVRTPALAPRGAWMPHATQYAEGRAAQGELPVSRAPPCLSRPFSSSMSYTASTRRRCASGSQAVTAGRGKRAVAGSDGRWQADIPSIARPATPADAPAAATSVAMRRGCRTAFASKIYVAAERAFAVVACRQSDMRHDCRVATPQ